MKKGGNMQSSQMSGFSIGDTENDKLKLQLKNLTDTFEEEKQRKETVIEAQAKEVMQTAKDLEEAETMEAKQRVRMGELQDELAQTIKRIE